MASIFQLRNSASNHYGDRTLADELVRRRNSRPNLLRGSSEGKPANFLVLDADTPFYASADVLASIRNGEYLFKRPDPSYEIKIDLFRKIK